MGFNGGALRDVEGTGGDGTGRAETGGQASSQHPMVPTALLHHLLFMYSKNTITRAPSPAMIPNNAPPSVPEKKKTVMAIMMMILIECR